MNLTLKVWRQTAPGSEGRFETYDVPDISPTTSLAGRSRSATTRATGSLTAARPRRR